MSVRLSSQQQHYHISDFDKVCCVKWFTIGRNYTLGWFLSVRYRSALLTPAPALFLLCFESTLKKEVNWRKKKTFELHRMLISSLDLPSSLFLELAFVIFLLILCNLGKQASFILLSLLINKTLNNRLCAALAACFMCPVPPWQFASSLPGSVAFQVASFYQLKRLRLKLTAASLARNKHGRRCQAGLFYYKHENIWHCESHRCI